MDIKFFFSTRYNKQIIYSSPTNENTDLNYILNSSKNQTKVIQNPVKYSPPIIQYSYNTQSIQNYIDNFKGGNVKKTVVQADTKKAENDVDKLNAKLNNINGKKVKADVKTNASSELNK